MIDTTHILVYSLIILLGILLVLNLVFGKARIVKMYSRKGNREYFDKTNLPLFVKLVVASMVISIAYSVIITRDLQEIVQFTIGSTIFVAIGLVNIVLYKRDK